MQNLISNLVDKKYAYVTKNGVYFSVSKFTEYGKLSKKKIDDLVSGARVEIDEEKNNPFDFETVKKNIEEKLNPKYKNRFKIMLVPNITNISYGRGVGYNIEEVALPEKIQQISATKIRDKMRKDGKLK